MNKFERGELLDGVRFDSDAGKNLTIRQYLHVLLQTLWTEQEGFSGKRPFGNSGWSYDLYKPLIQAGAIRGKLDEDGYIDRVDSEGGDELMKQLISDAMGIEA
jgi:hypothetical protein